MIETLTLVHGDLSVDVLPTRGLDLAGARFRGERFSWESWFAQCLVPPTPACSCNF